MKNYIGRKCKGFRFEDGVANLTFSSMMQKHMGEIGIIKEQSNGHVVIQFKDDRLSYPISLIEEHLIPESPEIPQLGEGVEMEVSTDNITWYRRKVIAKMNTGLFVTNGGLIWDYARPIHKVKKYTKEELVKILGHDFEMV
jgi:hypothetical protein